MATPDPRPAASPVRDRPPARPRQLRLLEGHEASGRALAGPSPAGPAPAPAGGHAPAASSPAGRGGWPATRASSWQLDPATRALGRRRVAEAKDLVARLRARTDDDGTRRCA